MNKKLIRLTEGDLHRIVKESVNRILNEVVINTPYGSVNHNDLDFDGRINQIENPMIRQNYLNSIDRIRKYYPIWCKQHGVEDDVDEVIMKIKKFAGYPYNANFDEACSRYLPLEFIDFLRKTR